MPERSVEAESRAPVMHDEDDVLCQSQGIEPPIEICGMVGEAIGLAWRFAGTPHADQVWHETTRQPAYVAYDVSPDIRRGRVPVEQHHRVAMSRVDIADFGIQHADATTRMRISGVDRQFH
jgi:hypothetical protein